MFGALRVAQAVLPIMRKQGYGRIVNTSSVLGFLPAPFAGIYAATKHALEAISESLDHEVRHLNVRSILIEPAYTATSLTDHVAKADQPHADYTEVRHHMEGVFATATAAGDSPDVIARMIAKIVRKKTPNVRYPVGKPAGLLAMLRKFMPAGAFESSFRQQFGLNTMGVRRIA